MAGMDKPPVWVNLEHLSAEDYVERSHQLPSPQMSGPGKGLTKFFFYPGFTRPTGGLLRERPLTVELASFDRQFWLAARGFKPRPGERVVSLFCYDNPNFEALIELLSRQPTLLLATPGAAQLQIKALLDHATTLGQLRVLNLPFLPQPDYDRLLWSCDINFVRGEDSIVRAQWAGVPFVWQIYPQDDNAHAGKLDAFLSRFLEDADAALAESVRALWRGWNSLGPWPASMPNQAAWAERAHAWRADLVAQLDLSEQLLRFVNGKGRI
jgi:uncharacterized repeat protein (TIGR03837 family)